MSALSALQRHVSNDKLETLVRGGFVAKGAVYCLIGAISVQAAFSGGSASGGKGAIETIGSQPFGQALLVMTGIGLLAYALYRAFQAVFDVEGNGLDVKGVTKRLGYGLSAAANSLLGISALQMAMGGGSGGGEAGTKSIVGEILASDGGNAIVGFVGVFVIGAGLYQAYKAYTTKFEDELKTSKMSEKTRRTIRVLGRAGMAARAVVFPIIGVYLLKAALADSAAFAKGTGGALREIGSSGFGSFMLAVVAIGLAAYGAYVVASAKYRKMKMPSRANI